ncbi:ribonuclease P protein component [Leifsonia sp. AG29]|uniref:ribonuclease P protein component n=1 Tax=Leifsonia sp. AG29 TaxID=2598860 RepID=UPI00131B22FA|nr:ribonuclease P protein component [Leifsonia sp. AG29]
MLAKRNRITRGADYRATVRRGVRFSGTLTVTYVRTNVDSGAVRFGFIAGKTVGDAVRRNLVRRRLKAIAYELLPRLADSSAGGPGVDIVVRALPASAQAGWASLHEEVSRAVSRYLSRSATR